MEMKTREHGVHKTSAVSQLKDLFRKNQTEKTTPGTEDMRTSETVEQIILPHHLRIPKQKIGNNVTWYYDKQTPLSVSSPNFPFYCFHLRLSRGKGGQ